MKNKKVTVKKSEEKIVPLVWINDSESTINFTSKLDCEESKLHIVGLFLGTGKQEVTFNTTIIHEAKKTKSRTTIRGVFFGNSSFSNDGLIRIERGAKHADGYFDSKILLFENSIGRSVPSLEISESELKAGHASTVGRPDPEQLFYLQSRGLSQRAAERLLVAGFFANIIQYFPIKDQKTVQKKIESLL